MNDAFKKRRFPSVATLITIEEVFEAYRQNERWRDELLTQWSKLIARLGPVTVREMRGAGGATEYDLRLRAVEIVCCKCKYLRPTFKDDPTWTYGCMQAIEQIGLPVRCSIRWKEFLKGGIPCPAYTKKEEEVDA